MTSREYLVRCIHQAEIISETKPQKATSEIINLMKKELDNYDFWKQKLVTGTEKEKESANFYFTELNLKNIDLGFHNHVQAVWHITTNYMD